MAVMHNVFAIIITFLFISADATINEGYGMLVSHDDNPYAEQCPPYTIDCTITDVCCPIGTFCFGGVFQGICCPTNDDCSSEVIAKPSCANSSWELFDASKTSAAQVGVNDYIFCCDSGQIGVDEGPACWAKQDSTMSLFTTALAATISLILFRM